MNGILWSLPVIEIFLNGLMCLTMISCRVLH